MANGKEHDHPLTDYTIWGKRKLPEPILDLIDRILAVDPTGLHSRPTWDTDLPMESQPYDAESERAINGDWYVWEEGKRVEEAIVWLQDRLKEVTDAASSKQGDEQL